MEGGGGFLNSWVATSFRRRFLLHSVFFLREAWSARTGQTAAQCVPWPDTGCPLAPGVSTQHNWHFPQSDWQVRINSNPIADQTRAIGEAGEVMAEAERSNGKRQLQGCNIAAQKYNQFCVTDHQLATNMLLLTILQFIRFRTWDVRRTASVWNWEMPHKITAALNVNTFHLFSLY